MNKAVNDDTNIICKKNEKGSQNEIFISLIHLLNRQKKHTQVYNISTLVFVK